MQLLQLDMLCELDKLCRRHGIIYAISFGTLLGAIRHKGYIPWDDDADVVMIRSEYERFRIVANELPKTICWFQDHYTDHDYRWEYGKLRRTGTRFVRLGQEHVKGETGVFIDIFPLDDIPDFLPFQIVQDAWLFFLRKILYSEARQYLLPACNTVPHKPIPVQRPALVYG